MACRSHPVLAALLAFALLTVAGRSPSAAAAITDPPWRAFGRVQTDFGTRCTGFLIAPALVMTAAHCLYRHATGRFVLPGSVHFLLRYDHGQYAAHAHAVSFVVSPGYDPAMELATLGLDRAFLTLDHPVGTDADTLRFAPALPSQGATLLTGGYNRDRDEILEIGTCHLLGYRLDHGGHRLILNDCPGEPGTSGAALLAQGPHGHWDVVGLSVARTAPDGRYGLAEPLAR